MFQSVLKETKNINNEIFHLSGIICHMDSGESNEIRDKWWKPSVEFYQFFHNRNYCRIGFICWQVIDLRGCE